VQLIYAVASYLAFLILWPFLVVHHKTRPGQLRRLGFYPPRRSADAGGRPRIWLHGSSAGDLLALKPMVAELKRRFPGCVVVMSAFTNTGYQMAKERIPEADEVTWVPWDLPGATSRALAAIDPDLLVLEYTEIWPNLLRAARRRGVKVAITNGRFSPANLERYRRFFRLAGDPLAKIDLFLMREEEEAERALALGAAPDRVWVTGNTKFDGLVGADPGDESRLRAALGDGPFLIAGSTHEGEEAQLLPVFRRLRAEHPTLRLAIAPRYVERAPKLLALAQLEGFSAGLRSAGARDADVVIVDTIGELTAVYRLATLVFVGGSFTNRGGQNILEPAGQGKPVLFGPNMDNFRDSVQVLVGRGGIQVRDAEHLYRVAHELLGRPDKLEELGGLARAAVGGIRGASARNVEHMARVLAPAIAIRSVGT
jgi:3-deoxy-D-manno-octulosonic-acid transferase